MTSSEWAIGMQDAYRIGLAATLRKLRRSRGLSQRAMAAPLHLAAHKALEGFLRALGVSGEHLPVRLDDQAALFRSAVAERRMLVRRSPVEG